MQTLLFWSPALVLTITAAVMIVRDPRRMRCAYFAGAAVLAISFSALTYLAPALSRLMGEGMIAAFVAAFLLAFALVLGTAVFLIWAGVVLLVREGASVSHSLSLVLGMGILWYLAAVYFSDRLGWVPSLNLLILLGFPILVFSFALSSFVIYSALYGFVARRWGRVGQSVVVLGSGLIGDRVPPLLARRVDLGVVMFLRACAKWPDPALVMSGGQGEDEKTSEGSAMMRYALESAPSLDALPVNAGDEGTAAPNGDVEAGPVLLVEDRSVNTAQNLQFSRVLLQSSGRSGPWTVVTSNFHAFRAANLMSRLHIAGNAVGAPTRSYFWASAKLREFAALLVMSKGVTVTFMVISFFPVAVLVANLLISLF